MTIALYIDVGEMSIVGPPPRNGWRFFCPNLGQQCRRLYPGIKKAPGLLQGLELLAQRYASLCLLTHDQPGGKCADYLAASQRLRLAADNPRIDAQFGTELEDFGMLLNFD